MATKPNPLFTRSEKRRAKKKVVHKIKGAARKGFAKLFGIPLSPGLGGKKTSSRQSAHRSPGAAPASTVRRDVISALTNLGYNTGQAMRMVPAEQSGEGFDSLFRRSVKKNPAELIIFGNPAKVYGRKNVESAKRKGNPIPAALLMGFESTLGSLGASSLMSGKKSHRGVRKGTQRKKGTKSRNPGSLDKAKDLYDRFQHRPGEVYESQRSARIRKDYTILGPLVAIGTNAEEYDKLRKAYIQARGKAAWEEYCVEHWDKLPHLLFLSGPEVNQVKQDLGQPDKYIGNCPQLASSPSGKQLYALTPDPPDASFISQFDTDATKDYIDLGEATFVVYIAAKPFDILEHVHTMGEEGGTRPRLNYNRVARELFFTGGSYHVDGPGIMH